MQWTELCARQNFSFQKKNPASFCSVRPVILGSSFHLCRGVIHNWFQKPGMPPALSLLIQVPAESTRSSGVPVRSKEGGQKLEEGLCLFVLQNTFQERGILHDSSCSVWFHMRLHPQPWQSAGAVPGPQKVAGCAIQFSCEQTASQPLSLSLSFRWCPWVGVLASLLLSMVLLWHRRDCWDLPAWGRVFGWTVYQKGALASQR